ncbi:hypothetical protein COO60DRAFT_665403 [Scenedesmus sp. NREL 46B-D3]|nr:hypothetical protein COO60DRAFT_665403 [Scenedesmus sp. NREL 46B-D3]
MQVSGATQQACLGSASNSEALVVDLSHAPTPAAPWHGMHLLNSPDSSRPTVPCCTPTCPLQDADDEQQRLPQVLLQQVGYTDLDLAVDVAQLNARLRSGDFKRWWQDLSPPLVFSLGQQQYSPAGTCIVTSINAFLQAEARRYTAAGTVSMRRERLSDLLGIRSRQVFLDKAAKGGWVLLARQHGVQLADLTPLLPLFERLERPSLSLCHAWPTPQADAAVAQVLQVAAANVPEGVLVARTGSKAVTAAIDNCRLAASAASGRPGCGVQAGSMQAANTGGGGSSRRSNSSGRTSCRSCHRSSN